MHSAKLTTPKYFYLLLIAFSFQLPAFSQENSPYSRYGLGDIVPNHNVQTRGMGGVAAAVADFQGVNSTNPASYANLTSTLFDVGTEVDTRKLKSTSGANNFSATNALFSYMQLGLPIRMKKANKKDIFLGVTFGLKPVSRINYKIVKYERNAIDSLATIYQGSGGLNQAQIGAGLRIKNFSIGANFGYMFGNKNYATQITFLNDTVFYHESNTASSAHFGGLFYNAGLQYEIKLKKNSFIRLGAYGSLKQDLTATNDRVIETVIFDASGQSTRVDSVFEKSISGKVVYPSTYGAGFLYQQNHWSVGADFEQTNWKEYSFYGQPDSVKNTWKIKVGTEYLPADIRTPTSKYFSFVRYRFGFYFGPDYIKLKNNLPEYGITIGAGFPLKLKKTYYETQTSILNTAIEFGSRGNKNSTIRENIMRICVGFSLGDLWFRRAKYD